MNFEFHPTISSDLNRWRSFLVISNLGSLARAADFLNSSQPILSRQLSTLEKECGARLFNRTGRGMELSETGKRILPRITDLLRQAEQLETEIGKKGKAPAGVVRIGTLPSVSTLLTRRLYHAVRNELPEVRLKIYEGSSGLIKNWLADSVIDVGIMYRYGAHPPEHDQLLMRVDTYLVSAKGDHLTLRPEVDFARLQEIPLALPIAPDSLRSTLDGLAKARNMKLQARIEIESLPLLKQFIASEHLYTLLPLHAVWPEITSGLFQASKIVSPSIERMITITRGKGADHQQAVTAVAQLISRLFGSLQSHQMVAG